MAQIQLKTRLSRLALTNENKYFTSAVRYSTISQDDLVKYASENSGLSKANMAAAFYAIAQQIEQFVCNGHGIQLGHLGTLYITTRAKAVDSEREAGAEAVYGLNVRFRQSKYLREHLNANITLNTIESPDFDDDDTTQEPEGGNTGNDDTQLEDPLG